MSWEIQGFVSLDDVENGVAALPFVEEAQGDESGQADAVRAALTDLLGSGSIGGPAVFVRAGGTASPGHVPTDGDPAEFLTLTIEYQEQPAEADAPPSIPSTLPPPPVAMGAQPAGKTWRDVEAAQQVTDAAPAAEPEPATDAEPAADPEPERDPEPPATDETTTSEDAPASPSGE